MGGGALSGRWDRQLKEPTLRRQDVVRAIPGGVLVDLRVRPRSRPGWEIAARGLVIRVAAAPVGGAATEEARRALAKALGVTPSRVSLHRGERSRTKLFAVTDDARQRSTSGNRSRTSSSRASARELEVLERLPDVERCRASSVTANNALSPRVLWAGGIRGPRGRYRGRPREPI